MPSGSMFVFPGVTAGDEENPPYRMVLHLQVPPFLNQQSP